MLALLAIEPSIPKRVLEPAARDGAKANSRTHSMTRPRGFIDDWQPRQKSLMLLQQVDAIIAEYAMPLTIRQIFYRLVGRHGYDKTEQAYDRLGELLAKARRAGHIAMDAIRDDGFTSHIPQYFDSAEDFLEAVRHSARTLRLDYQHGQPRRLVVMCEASGMAPQLYRIAQPYGVAVLSGGGFDSLTDKHRLAEEWAAAEQPTTVLRIGDYDPSGASMFTVLTEDIGAFAVHYGGDIEFVPVAITPEQARARALPSAPPKPTDRRGRHFSDSETWQAEALDPNELAQILADAIRDRLDLHAYHAVRAEEEETRQAVISRLDLDGPA